MWEAMGPRKKAGVNVRGISGHLNRSRALETLTSFKYVFKQGVIPALTGQVTQAALQKYVLETPALTATVTHST